MKIDKWDGLLVLGALCITVGAFLYELALGFIVLGTFLTGFAITGASQDGTIIENTEAV